MNSKALYRRLLGYVHPYRGMFALSILGTVLFAATEPAMPALMKPLLDETFIARDPEAMIRLPLLLIALFLVRGVTGFAGDTAMQWVATRVVMDLRTAMFDRLLTLPVHYFDNHTSGNLIARHTFNVQRVMEATTSVVVTLVKDTLIVIGLLSWAFYINWQLSLIILAVTPPTAWVIRLVSRRLRNLNHALQDTMGELTRIVQETAGSSREIKIYGGIDYEKSRFRKFNDRIRRGHLQLAAVSEANVPIVQLLTVIALSVVIYFAALQSQTGEITVGEFVSLVGALALLSSPVKRLTKINVQLQSGLAAAESVFALIDEAAEQDAGNAAVTQTAGNIAFRHVSYTPRGNPAAVLHDISLELRAGETVALVGPSGGGKTTLASLLPRFYLPTSGTIQLDGIDIQALRLTDLRRQIAYVGQHIMLFNDTVGANIAYGAQGGATPESIRVAAEKAHVLEFTGKLPQGLGTLIGENGVRLSAGQRQRIAIARALIKDTPILILDEATSALDSESEHIVQLAIDALRRGRTSLVIAHRLSTIENADRIVVLEGGRIVETGTHAELLQANGLYARLYRLQAPRR
ncbi:MAG: lipid A export permease/ATP-binding protein MsbA [Gammaproteobacteria bacterium]